MIRVLQLARWFLEHNMDAENCDLPDKLTTCLFTTDLKYYKIAGCLACSVMLHKRAYPKQLVLSKNRDPDRFGCNRPSYAMKIADVRISYTLSSTISYPYVCTSDIQQGLLNIMNLKPPSDRNGIAMFISNCGSTGLYIATH